MIYWTHGKQAVLDGKRQKVRKYGNRRNITDSCRRYDITI